MAALLAALARTGLRLSVLTTDRRLPAPWTAQLGAGLSVVVVPARARGFARDLHRSERHALAAATRRLRPDLVHAQWTYEYALAAYASGCRPVVIGMRDWAPAILRLEPHPYNLARVAMQLVALRRADAVTVNSPYLRRKAALVGRRAVLVPNAVADGWFTQTDTTRADDLLLAVLNGFTGYKNAITLLRALPTVRRARPATRLSLVGAGHEPQGPAARWAAAHDLTAGVAFDGTLPADEVGRRMREATILVHPSLEESFGTVLVEAMASGTPVVAGQTSGAVPWVLGTGRFGVLCDVGSPDALAAALLALLDDPGRRERLAEAARRHAQRSFRADAVAYRLGRLYRLVHQRAQQRTRR
jgi:L-malate glycosyltransferase